MKTLKKLKNLNKLKRCLTLLTKSKENKKNDIAHGKIVTKLPNFDSFDHDALVNVTHPDMKTYKYYNAETKKMDQIQFPDYEKWYKENKGVWVSEAYGNAKFTLEYVDENTAHVIVKRRTDSYKFKPKYLDIIERMNKIYTKIGDRINESTDWVHYFYDPKRKWSGSVYLRQYPTSYWEDVRQLSLKYHTEEPYRKRAYSIYPEEKHFSGVEEKDPFLVYDDEKNTRHNNPQK